MSPFRLRILGCLTACAGMACLAFSVVATGTAGAAISNPTRHVLAYVTETAADAVAVIDTQASPTPLVLGTISTTTPTSKTKTCHPQSVTSGPTLAWVYVGCTGRATPNTTHSLAQGAIEVIDTATNAVSASLALAADPIATAVSPDGKTLYALSLSGAAGDKFAIEVISLDAGIPTLAATVDLPAGQWVNPNALGALAVGDNGARVAVAVSTTATTTVSGGAVDVFTVAAGSLTPSPHQYAFGVVAPSALSFNPDHPSWLYVAPGFERVGVSDPADEIAVITVTKSSATPTSQFNWPTPPGPTSAVHIGQLVVSTNGTTAAATVATDSSYGYVAPFTIASGTPAGLTAVTVTPPVGTPHPVTHWVYLGTTGTGGPFGASLLPGGSELYVVLHGYTTPGAGKTVPSQVRILDAVTKVVPNPTFKLTLGNGGGASGVAFGQPAAPAPTTTTTSSTTTTTTTVPPTTTTIVPATTTTTVPRGPQLAYTGDDVTPWLAAGGSLLAAGVLLLVVDARRRRPAHVHRRSR